MVPNADLTHQREVADAFLTASRSGGLDALLAVLDPDVRVALSVGGCYTLVSRAEIKTLNLHYLPRRQSQLCKWDWQETRQKAPSYKVDDLLV